MREAQGQPPVIDGHTYVRELGAGGYSDVFLYRSHAPEREVAVKVMRGTTLTPEARAQFTDEANTMARVSHHPHIVEIFQVGVASDGRPYIVMQYYEGGSYAARAKAGRIALAEVLRTGIQIASAVETAHGMEIVHRDIKPANILLNRFDNPGLTDFGIAAVPTEADDAEGMSPPWSPPEVFEGRSAGVRSDVYSLAATLWHLLVGRAPFQVPGGDNSELALMRRVLNDPVPPTGRRDIPPSLERVLQAGMTKDAENRTPTAVALALALQEIEKELGYPRTRLDLKDQARHASPPQTSALDADETNLRVPRTIDPQAPPAPGETGRRRGRDPVVSAAPAPGRASAGSERQRSRPSTPPEPAPDDTKRRPDEPAEEAPAAVPRAVNRKWLIAALAGTVVIAVAGAVALSSGGKEPSTAASTTVAEVEPQELVGSVTPGKPTVRAQVRPGAVAFGWGGYDNALASDSFRWRQSGTGKPQQGVASTPSLRVGATKDQQVCLVVQVIRADGSEPSPLSDVTCSR